jgi:dihydrofolate synthase/folylpolyglutamate synthase
MPQNVRYYFTQAPGERAMPAWKLAKRGEAFGLKGKYFLQVRDAVSDAIKRASGKDFIFIGGSAFIVAEALRLFPNAIK